MNMQPVTITFTCNDEIASKLLAYYRTLHTQADSPTPIPPVTPMTDDEISNWRIQFHQDLTILHLPTRLANTLYRAVDRGTYLDPFMLNDRLLSVSEWLHAINSTDILAPFILNIRNLGILGYRALQEAARGFVQAKRTGP